MSIQIGLLVRQFRNFFNRWQGPDVACLGLLEPSFIKASQWTNVKEKKEWDPLEFLRDPFQWATPKQRRSVEVRLWRKFADKFWLQGVHNAMPRRKRNIIPCESCGGWREAHALCKTCYDRISEESKAISDRIASHWGLNPITKDAFIRYKNDELNHSRIADKIPLEMEKERPKWFPQTLTTIAGPRGPLEETNTIEAPAKPKMNKPDSE